MSKEKNIVYSKFFEVFNQLELDQLAELSSLFEAFSNEYTLEQQDRLRTLIIERKGGRVLNEEWAKIHIWKDAVEDWNKDKAAFQKIIDRYLLADLRYQDFWGDYLLLTYYRAHYLEKNFNLLWSMNFMHYKSYVWLVSN